MGRGTGKNERRSRLPGLSIRLTYANVVSTICLFILLGGGAWAATSIVGPDGRIHACVGKGGALSVAKPGTPCPRGESALSWIQNVSGPAGGDLRGRYPNPTLRPAKLVGFTTQPSPSAAPVDCSTHFNTLCGDVNSGSYWNQAPNGYAFSGYWVDAWGFVHLEGSVWRVGAPGDVIVVLPPNLRPVGTLQFPVRDTRGTVPTVEIDPDGSVSVFPANSGDVISLSGITYHP